MKSIDINTTLIEGYLRLLNNLSPGNKRDLISRLRLSVKNDTADSKTLFFEAYGAWESNQSADDLIIEIRKSRTLNRQIETF